MRLVFSFKSTRMAIDSILSLGCIGGGWLLTGTGYPLWGLAVITVGLFVVEDTKP